MMRRGMPATEHAATIDVIVACRSAEVCITLPTSSTIASALAHPAVAGDTRLAGALQSAAAFGVWGRVRRLQHELRAGDRLEIYGALRADPKEARRRRAQS
jgi:putative ubiquitin-RnfH superfamily antitoxin RatB of RatAB toxin-antitoxin module